MAGITTIVWLPSLPPLAFIALLPLFLVAGRFVNPHIFAFVLGALWSLSWSHWQIAHRLDSLPVKSDWRVTGVVTGLPEQDKNQARFTLSVETLAPKTSARLNSRPPRVLRLNWYHPNKVLEPGMSLTLDVRIKPPHGFSNPAGFDYELWLLARGIDATGYVREMLAIKAAPECWLDCMRYHLVQYVEDRYQAAPVQGLVKAITLGVRDGFDEAQWQQLRATGTLHLAVISGLHIGFAALAGLLLVKLVSRYIPVHAKNASAALIGIAIACLYMLIAGAGLPTQRAFVMVSVFLLAQWRRWHIDLWTRWWLAMAAVLTLTPVATHQAGFWLSFLAVATLLWFSVLRVRDFLGWRVQLGIFCTMTPVLVFVFGGFSLIAPLVNILAIPLMALCLMAAFVDLVASLLGFQSLIIVVEGLSGLFWLLIEQGASVQADIWRVPDVPVWCWMMAVAGSCLLIQPAGFPARWLGLVLWLPMCLGIQNREAETGFGARIFDVGQGLAVLVSAGGKQLLYDAGPAYPNGKAAFGMTLLPYLQHAGIKVLDKLVLSHNDLDHTGGHQLIRKNLIIDKATTGSPELVQRYGYGLCQAGDYWRWGNVSFRLLSGGQGASDNNRSCVLLIDDGHCSLLLTGDIDQTIERKLPTLTTPLTWLVASHHGSNTGTSRDFLTRWQPETVIFSAGFVNQFSHPDPRVIKRVQQQGANVLSTAQQGSVYLHSGDTSGCSASTWRTAKRRFWSGY
ncbi:MAG: DNA internalization-related competence protein ComEC/Rec2 [Pontibacterium sp.]